MTEQLSTNLFLKSWTRLTNFTLFFFFPLEPKSVWLEFPHFLQVIGEVSAGVRLPDLGPVHIERPLRAHVVRAQP